MHTTTEPTTDEITTELVAAPVAAPVKLAAAWTSLLFVFVYVDIFGLYMPGVIDDILAGIVWEFEISQTWATGALALMVVPILMVLGSLILSPRATRMANLVVAPIYMLVSVGNAIDETWVYYFTLAIGVEVLILAVIIRTAWTWPRAAVGR